MSKNSYFLSFLGTCAGLLLCGCPSGEGGANGDAGNGANEDTSHFDLPLVGMAPVELIPGETVSARHTITLPALRTPLASASVDMTRSLQSLDLTFLDGDEQKGSTAQQGLGATLTFYVGPAETADTVCETGASYGPFTINTNAQDQPTSTTPESVAMSADTVSVVNLGQFAICMQVLAHRRATASLSALSIDYRMEDETDDCEPVSNFAGHWRSEYACTDSCNPAGFGGVFCTTVNQDGRDVSYSEGDLFSGTACGNVWTFSVEPGAGYNETGTLTLNANGTATRESDWSSGSCFGVCTDTFTPITEEALNSIACADD